jgi:hypothetical protein
MLSRTKRDDTKCCVPLLSRPFLPALAAESPVARAA